MNFKELLAAFGYMFFITMNFISLLILSYTVNINFGYAVTQAIYCEAISASLLLAYCIRSKLFETLKNKKIIGFVSGILLVVVCYFAVFHNLNLIMWKMGHHIDERMIQSGVLSSFFYWFWLTIFIPVMCTLALIDFPRCFLKNRHT